MQYLRFAIVTPHIKSATDEQHTVEGHIKSVRIEYYVAGASCEATANDIICARWGGVLPIDVVEELQVGQKDA